MPRQSAAPHHRPPRQPAPGRRLGRMGMLAAGLLPVGIGIGAVDLEEPIRQRLIEPEIRFQDGQVIVYGLAGFELVSGRRHLVGRSIRINQTSDTIFATGSLVLQQPGLHLEADRLGGDRQLQRGEAWNVRLRIPHPDGAFRLEAERITYDATELVCHGVRFDAGHGAVGRLDAERIVVGLRPTARDDRLGPGRHLTHIAIWHPLARLGPLPFFYSPLIYRDFRLDYPWTRYEFGDGSRTGPWLSGWTRVDWHMGADQRLRLLGRYSWYDRIGEAVGVRPQWRLGPFGEGELLWFGFDDETVRRDPDEEPRTRREAHVTDARHRLPFPGGGLAARWTELPDGDPDAPVDDRFRADYLEPDLRERTLARRGVQAAAHWGYAGLAAVVEQPPERRQGTERQELHLALPELQVLGPLHLSARGSTARLRREAADEEARRNRFSLGLGFAHWFRWGLGLNVQGGLEGRSYDQLQDPDTSLVETDELMPTLAAEARLRWLGRFGSVRHTLTPRVGLTVTGRTYGDEELPTVAFDPDDGPLESDRRLLITALETAVTAPGRQFRAELEASWGLRREDAAQEPDELEDVWDRLVEVTITASGSPHRVLTVSGNGTWAGAEQDWTSFDATVTLRPIQALQLGTTMTWQRIDGETVWQYKPQLSLFGNRYRLDTWVIYDDDETMAAHDRYAEIHIEASRRMVDGLVGLSYDIRRDRIDDKKVIDHRVLLTFSLDPFTSF